MNYSRACVSFKICSLCSFSVVFFAQPWIVPSHTGTDYCSAEGSLMTPWTSPGLSLWATLFLFSSLFSILKRPSLSGLPALSPELGAHTRLLQCPSSLQQQPGTLSRQSSGTFEGFFSFVSPLFGSAFIVGFCILCYLMPNVWKLFYIFHLIFSYFKWENKCSPCYYILAGTKGQIFKCNSF